MPDVPAPAPHLALQRLHNHVRDRARPLHDAAVRWETLLLEHRWHDAHRLLDDQPSLVRVPLALDAQPVPATPAWHEEGEGDIPDEPVTGPLPLWLAHRVDWQRTSADSPGLVPLVQAWHRLGGRWSLAAHGRSSTASLLSVLAEDHTQDAGLWTTLLRAGWPAAEEGWVLDAVLNNPHGNASFPRLRTALAVLDEQPDLLTQPGPQGDTAWHLLMTTLPGLLDGRRVPLADQLVQRLRALPDPCLASIATNDRGQRPVDLVWPEVDSPDPQDHEAHRDFPYWALLRWMEVQPSPRLDPDLVSVWQRQVDLHRTRHPDHPVFQAFAARMEQEALYTLNVPLGPTAPRRRM